MENMKRIKSAFPLLQEGFYDVLCERLKANGFYDDEFEKAVSYVIDNYKYPTPSIAEFLNFDGGNYKRLFRIKYGEY
jgi:hypothetical protein